MNPEFTTHMLNATGRAKAEAIAEAFDNLLNTINTICPDGREFSLCKTKLEEASFYAKKSMAKDKSNQVTINEGAL